MASQLAAAQLKRRLSVTNFSSENNVSLSPWWQTTGAFSWNVGKLFSKLKLVTDNLLFIYVHNVERETEYHNESWLVRTSPTVQLQPLYTSVFIRLTHSDWLFQGIACQKALMGKGCGLASKMPQQQCPLMKVLKSSRRPLIPLLTTKCQSNWSRIFYVFDVRLKGKKMSIKTFTTLSRGLTKLQPGYLVWIHHFQDLWTTNCYFFDLKKNMQRRRQKNYLQVSIRHEKLSTHLWLGSDTLIAMARVQFSPWKTLLTPPPPTNFFLSSPGFSQLV